MKDRVAIAVWVFALTAAAQQAPDKPSPVPRRPARPSICAHAAGEVRTITIAQHKTRPNECPPEIRAGTLRAPAKYEGDRHRLLLLFKRERRDDSQRGPTQ